MEDPKRCETYRHKKQHAEIRLVEEKQDLIIYCIKETNIKFKYTNRLKVNE